MQNVPRFDITDRAISWLDMIVKSIRGENSAPYLEQIRIIRTMVNSLLEKGNAVLCQAPTGIGKTATVAALAITYAELGKRILISSPNYGHIKKTLSEHFRVAPPTIKIVTLPGFSHREMKKQCVKEEGSNPRRKICRTWETQCQNLNCPIEEVFRNIKSANIVNIVHSKLIADFPLFVGERADRYLGEFDIILIDECHNLPDVIESNWVQKVTFLEIEKYLPKISDLSIRTDLQDCLELSDDTSIDKNELGKEIINIFRENRESLRKDLQGSSLSNLIGRNHKIKTGSDALYCIKEPTSFDFKKRVSVGLFSATVSESRIFLFNECHFDGLAVVANVQLFGEDCPTVMERWKRLAIYSATDVADLKKEVAGYESHRTRANDFILTLITHIEENTSVDFITLILCRSKDDANSIKKSFINKSSIYEKMVDIDELEDKLRTPENSIEDLSDLLYEGVHKELEKGKKYLLVTGSSLFWEAGTIENLRLVIIDALPYRAPTVKESFDKRRGMVGHFSNHPVFLFMLRRLQQGIGRLMRRDSVGEKIEWGIAVIIDQRFRDQWKDFIGRKEKLPDLIRRKVRFLNGEELLTRIPRDIQKLQLGKKLSKDLTDFGVEK